MTCKSNSNAKPNPGQQHSSFHLLLHSNAGLVFLFVGLLCCAGGGLAVPGRPGPMVWGDMEGRLEEIQEDYLAASPAKLIVTAREP